MSKNSTARKTKSSPQYKRAWCTSREVVSVSDDFNSSCVRWTSALVLPSGFAHGCRLLGTYFGSLVRGLYVVCGQRSAGFTITYQSSHNDTCST